uniref:P-type phospholipid transporter n=1 Tax=Oncorhynchus tshawytscha TaxID=74940 RepID=A0A8C8J4V0_ONCTS
IGNMVPLNYDVSKLWPGELLWPLFLFLILVRVRSTNQPIYQGGCHYPNKAMPSSGLLPWLQGMMCNIGNPCVNHPTPGEAPGQVNNFNNSMYVEGQTFLPISIHILNDNEMFTAYLKKNLSMFLSLLTLLISFNKMMGISRQDNLRTTLCNGTTLDRYVEFTSASDKEAFQNVSCSLPAQQMRRAKEVFLQNLNTSKILTNNSMLFKSANTLDFRADALGSLNMLLCGKAPDSNSRNTTMNFSASGLMRNYTENSELSDSRNRSAFCKILIDTIEGTPGLHVFWSMFRPLIQGKVLYTPDTPATRLMANSTFNALAMIKELADAWEDFGHLVWDYFQNGRQVNTLRALLDNPVFVALLNQRLKGTRWTAELLANFLYNGPPEGRPTGMPPNDWRNAFNTTSQILDLLKKFIGCLNLDKFEAADSERHLMTRALELLESNRYWAGIVFEDLNPAASHPPPYVKYKIRMDIDKGERTNKIKERGWSPGARSNSFNDLRYIWGGFAYLQDMMDHGIIRAHTNKSQPLGVFAQQMPYPCYVDDVFIQSIGNMLPMCLVLPFMYTVCMTIKGLILEKAQGTHNGTFWVACFTKNCVLLLVACAITSVMVKYGKVLQYSDPSVIFVFMLVFCVATIMECFFISVFFSKANLAAACGGLIYFVLYLPHLLCYAWRDVLGFQVKIAVSLLSCVAFGYGCENFAKYEEQGIGIQWSNIAQNPEGDRYSFIVSIIMMLIDALIYWLLTWYIENVFPGQYGIAKPWSFPFMASYWCGMSAVPNADPSQFKDPMEYNDYLEKPLPNMKAGVSIRNLVKIYKTGKKLAVDGLSVDFYENHITSFLGHNGAGKTTTMSILTGLFAPTSGTALINGYDIRTDMDTIRKHLGMCPQHNVLFNDLTVEEHIYFYARLKGRSRDEVKTEMDQMIKDVGLPHKRKELAKNLSGGMQRKLSVAIAFVGGSNIVILDEPTAGVDPYARRGIWELLLKYKKGRTIILSTHHMDEADILGDRIAIISHGKMCCYGSSLFLKKYFGSGYYLTLVKAGNEQITNERSGETDETLRRTSLDEGIASQNWSNSDPTAVSKLVRRHVPEAVFLESIGQEITYILPYSGAKDGTFALLFKELDLEMADIGFTNYGISDTTLEEIFLKVAEDTGVDVEIPGKLQVLPVEWNLGGLQYVERVANVNGKGSSVIMGWELIRRQFLALFIKRFHHARRSRKGIIAQVILPAVFVCLSLIFSVIIPPFAEYPNLELQPWMYGLPQTTFYSNDGPPNNTEVAQVVDSLVNNPGFGTRCMANNPIPNLPCVPIDSKWTTPSVETSINNILINGTWSMANPSPNCQCSTPQKTIMLPDCPPGAGGLPPPQRIQNTTDTLQDLTGRNMTDFLLKTYEKAGKKRYGGISVGGVNSQVRMTEPEIEAVIRDLKSLFNSPQDNTTEQILLNAETLLKELGTRDNVKVWFYNQAWHGIVSFLNVANNAILRGNLPTGRDPREYGISSSSHPLNLTKVQLSYQALAATSTDLVVSICVIFAMSFIPASFVLFLIQERVNKAKHLQFVSGVNPAVYWVANFAWDICNYIVPCLIVIIIFLCFQQKAYVSPPNLPALIWLLVMYGWSITPMMYPASFIFSVPSTAYVVLTCVNLFIGINGSLATFVMELFDDDKISHINDIVKQVLLIFPHFCLGRGLIDMGKNQAMATLFERFGEDRFQDPLSWDMVGKNLCAMAIQGAVMFTITLLIQYKFCYKPRLISGKSFSKEDEDVDVARERARVHEGGAENDLLRICDLSKVYSGKNIPAVDRVCLGVPAAECFGLLGINGAGKTTTFKMLTGDIAISGGEAFLNRYSVRTEMRDVHQNMGYCPQFDALNDLLTGREHLEFYARLRGVPENEVTMVAEWGIQKLGLVKYSNKAAGTYSGGNKRKLSTAMALIGCPPVVFLDEPTTGMDPKARRFLWDCILSVIKEERSVILTSHSMEECEALCTRMAIMVNGQFKCLGSIQHLKSRFGDGYTVIVRVGGSPPALGPVEEFVHETFPGSILKEKHHNTLQYQLPLSKGALVSIFSQFTTHQQRLGVEDYSVSQTTLDQVFVNFARYQHEEDNHATYDNKVDVSSEMPMKTQNSPVPESA